MTTPTQPLFIIKPTSTKDFWRIQRPDGGGIGTIDLKLAGKRPVFVVVLGKTQVTISDPKSVKPFIAKRLAK